MANKRMSDNEMVEFIKSYIARHKYSPSIRDICNGLGIKSTSSVRVRLKSLRKQGYIDYVDNQARTITIKEVKK